MTNLAMHYVHVASARLLRVEPQLRIRHLLAVFAATGEQDRKEQQQGDGR